VSAPELRGPEQPEQQPDRSVDEVVRRAREAHAAELAEAAAEAAEAAAQGLRADGAFGVDSVRPVAGRPAVPRTASSGAGLAGPRELPRRRAGDVARGTLSDLPMYDPLSARRRRTPEWLSAYLGGLLLLDGLALVVAVLLAADLQPGPVHLLAAAGVWAIALQLAGAYREAYFGAGTQEYRRVLVAATGLVAALAVAESVAGPWSWGTTDVVLAVAVGAGLTVLGRRVARTRMHAHRRRGLMGKRVVLVGREVALVDIAERLRRDATSGWTVVGACVPDPGAAGGLARIDVPVLGGLDHVPAVLDQARADAVMVAAASEGGASYLRQLAWRLEGTNIEVLLAPGLVEVAVDRLEVRPTISFPVVQIMEPSYRGLRRLAKSALDRGAALVGLALLSPLLVALAVAVKREDGGPVLYRQARVGRHGRVFDVLKFRSMTVGADARVEELATADEGNGVLFKMRTDPRVTRTGQLLRRWSLDELPQLVNVLRGEMSLVGPRPALPVEVATYGPDMQRRLLVRPGVTGLWQVSGRSDLSWAETVELDVRYVDNWSVGRDLSILFRTARAVVAGSGAY
jgi:exopolysaccharide biosynthesis polyprenyl glycosylphosphotransferase